MKNMKKKLNAFWILSAIFLAVGAMWGAFSQLSNVIGTSMVCGISLLIFAVVSILAAFTKGLKNSGSGWLLLDGVTSFSLGLSFMFWYAQYKLFTVDISLIMALWLMFLGISQIARTSGKTTFALFLVKFTGVLGILGGLSLFVKPIADVLSISAGGHLQVYSTTFQLIVASLIVISRILLKDSSRK